VALRCSPGVCGWIRFRPSSTSLSLGGNRGFGLLLGYLRRGHFDRGVGLLGFFYNVLLLSLTLVFSSSNAFFFLLAWEVMALSAYCLVSFEHEKKETRTAGTLFLIMSTRGRGSCLAAFLVMAGHAGSLDFAGFMAGFDAGTAGQGDGLRAFLSGIRREGRHCSDPRMAAGRPPGGAQQHLRLMSASSSRPVCTGWRACSSTSSACRRCGPESWCWPPGSARVVGVLYALMEHDLKRLLAYHSIENIGIILTGFGAAFDVSLTGIRQSRCHRADRRFVPYSEPRHLQVLAFLGAGAVLEATHTRNMEKLGE